MGLPKNRDPDKTVLENKPQDYSANVSNQNFDYNRNKCQRISLIKLPRTKYVATFALFYDHRYSWAVDQKKKKNAFVFADNVAEGVYNYWCSSPIYTTEGNRQKRRKTSFPTDFQTSWGNVCSFPVSIILLQNVEKNCFQDKRETWEIALPTSYPHMTEVTFTIYRQVANNIEKVQ